MSKRERSRSNIHHACNAVPLNPRIAPVQSSSASSSSVVIIGLCTWNGRYMFYVLDLNLISMGFTTKDSSGDDGDGQGTMKASSEEIQRQHQNNGINSI